MCGIIADYTSLKIGGRAEIFILDSEDKISSAFAEKCVVLGKGTNVLVSDKGIAERVVINRLRGISFDKNFVTVASGESLPNLCRECAKRSLSGLEWACGIPGSVGGAVIMNAGAFGGQTVEAIEEVKVLTPDGDEVILRQSECGFSYRSSQINGFVISAKLKLAFSDEQCVLEKMREIAKARSRTQPTGKSAGCTFKNHGLGAGYYIERAGLKGARCGGARISEKHANFIINDTGASASDVLALIEKTERDVYARFGIKLQREIKLLGEF